MNDPHQEDVDLMVFLTALRANNHSHEYARIRNRLMLGEAMCTVEELRGFYQEDIEDSQS